MASDHEISILSWDLWSTGSNTNVIYKYLIRNENIGVRRYFAVDLGGLHRSEHFLFEVPIMMGRNFMLAIQWSLIQVLKLFLSKKKQPKLK